MPGPAGQHTLILQQERATKNVTGEPSLGMVSNCMTLSEHAHNGSKLRRVGGVDRVAASSR